MEETILKAIARSDSPNKIRKAGFVPGALNGEGTTSTSVQFEAGAVNKIIAKHGSNAKIWVEFGEEKKFGYIMEVQKHPVDAKVIHVSIKLVSADQEIKVRLPIMIHGSEELEHKLLQVQVYKSEIEVMGKATLMPDTVTVDVSKKELGETITAIDFNLPKEIKILEPENETFAVIKAAKEDVVETPAEVKPAVEAK